MMHRCANHVILAAKLVKEVTLLINALLVEMQIIGKEYLLESEVLLLVHVKVINLRNQVLPRTQCAILAIKPVMTVYWVQILVAQIVQIIGSLSRIRMIIKEHVYA